MVLRVDESKLYSAAYRSRVLDELTAALMEDKRIAGAVLVGSGAAGFKDRYSDIDLAVLVGDEARVDEVYADWWRGIHVLFPIVDAFKDSHVTSTASSSTASWSSTSASKEKTGCTNASPGGGSSSTSAA
jgi:hypothetical protein